MTITHILHSIEIYSITGYVVVYGVIKIDYNKVKKDFFDSRMVKKSKVSQNNCSIGCKIYSI